MDSRILLLGAAAIGLLGFGAPEKQPEKPAVDVARAAPVVAAPVAAAPVAVNADPTTPAARAQNAFDALSSEVRGSSHNDALRIAFKAYYNFAATHATEVRNPYFYFVDYGLDNRTPRGYVFNMDKLELVEGPFIVAHGRGSSIGKNAVPTRFTNRPGSASTSLGLYVAEETYSFSGHSGGQLYTSIGLRMDGKSGRFNSTARARGVVVHGAPYVTPSGSGRSEGCPAMEQSRARRLIPKIANGGVVFLFSPNDQSWMQQDPWINGSAE
jgi:hypothetical protein